ncbi:MAG: trehalose synthase [Clostridia bacterium]|nr:trehalose synthase [Clostridia bacterium]
MLFTKGVKKVSHFTLKNYETIAGNAIMNEIEAYGEKLQGYNVLHINSTAVGGGVAEILHSLVPLMQEVGLSVKWSVLKGSPKFFNTTKQFHNGLHGQQVNITAEMLEHYLANAQKNRNLLEDEADLIVLHDQQPLGLTAYRSESKSRWLWYCHIDPSYAVPSVWYFLAPLVAACDVSVFHLPEYARDLSVLQYFMPPAIDPLSDKNREVTPEEYDSILEKLDIDPSGPPIILQVSRFDRLKDPVGVIEAFRLVRKNRKCQLILAGGSADDDPEGAIVLEEVRELADNDPDIKILALEPNANLQINVLQRRANVIVQKSLREGFGLTATEALWKEKPLVATPTGGLAYQVIDGKTGLTAKTVEEVASQIERILANPDWANKLGSAGKKHVTQRFILPVYLRNWLRLITLLRGQEK